MQLVLLVDTWKNQVKSMEMGASNTPSASRDLDKRRPTLGCLAGMQGFVR